MLQRKITANGLSFTILEEGSAGPLALCLHGFPDTAHTWRHLLPALAAAGYRAVAPFTRGYAPTALAPEGSGYGLQERADDANALHEALGGDERSVLIGHDWGAETAYLAAVAAPERWRRLVTLAVPPLALDRRLFSDYEQLKRFFYLFFLKTPDAPAVVAADDYTFLDRLWHDWSPGYDATEDLAAVKRALTAPAHLDAAIAYYREPEPGLEDGGGAALATPPQPTLYLHGERDGCIDIRLVHDAEQHLAPGSRFAAIPGAGHFLHLERPDTINPHILRWLAAGD